MPSDAVDLTQAAQPRRDLWIRVHDVNRTKQPVLTNRSFDEFSSVRVCRWHRVSDHGESVGAVDRPARIRPKVSEASRNNAHLLVDGRHNLRPESPTPIAHHAFERHRNNTVGYALDGWLSCGRREEISIARLVGPSLNLPVEAAVKLQHRDRDAMVTVRRVCRKTLHGPFRRCRPERNLPVAAIDAPALPIWKLNQTVLENQVMIERDEGELLESVHVKKGAQIPADRAKRTIEHPVGGTSDHPSVET